MKKLFLVLSFCLFGAAKDAQSQAYSVQNLHVHGTTSALGSASFVSANTILNPSARGRTNGSTPGTGYWGEIQSAAFGTTTLTSNTIAVLGSASVPAGLWHVVGFSCVTETGATITANYQTAISTSSSSASDWSLLPQVTSASSATTCLRASSLFQYFSSTTTVYLLGQAGFSAGSEAATGSITWRRIK